MGQVDLNSCTRTSLVMTRKVYTMQDVEDKCKIWHKSNQLGVDGWPFCTFNSEEEIEWVKKAILDALNHPEVFNASDNYGALCNLKKLIKGKKAVLLRAKYGVPAKYEYRNIEGVNSIVDANHNDKVVIPLTAEEILDVIADLNKNRSPEDIFNAYDFHHETVTIECLETFQGLYCKGELNKCIKFICSKSNELGGFYDYGVGVIRNRLTSQYVFDSRRIPYTGGEKDD